jgi:pyrroline-5-carboxylate reductase
VSTLFIVLDAVIRTMSAKIGFIGAGKMAEALIGGLIAKGIFSKDEIVACAPSQSTRDRVTSNYGIRMFEKAEQILPETDLIVLAVKPRNVDALFTEEGLKIGKGNTVISIVAGLTLDKMNSYVPDAKKIRVMPNHCCMVKEGAMGYACDPSVDEKDKKRIGDILSSVGLAVEVPEYLMDCVTGIAGSSPAFFYMIIDAMAEAGVLNGMPRDQAVKLAAQSMLGSAKMVLETGKHPEQLRDEVCSPGGTTIVGVKTLEDLGLRSAMASAVDETIAKSAEMSKK